MPQTHDLTRKHKRKSSPTSSQENKKIIASIREICTFDDFDVARKKLRSFCNSAVADNYLNSGNPGSVIEFTQRLKRLVANCHELFSFKTNTERRLVKTTSFNAATHEPFDIMITDFFSFMNAAAWKQLLCDWQEAALSKFSILDAYEMSDVIKICFYLENLLEVGYGV